MLRTTSRHLYSPQSRAALKFVSEMRASSICEHISTHAKFGKILFQTDMEMVGEAVMQTGLGRFLTMKQVSLIQ